MRLNKFNATDKLETLNSFVSFPIEKLKKLQASYTAMESKFYTLWYEPRLPAGQGAAFSEGAHVNSIRNMQAMYNQLPDSSSSMPEDSTRCRTSASNHRKITRVNTQPRLLAGQGATFSESAHVNSIGNTQTLHNQLPNSASLILEACYVIVADRFIDANETVGEKLTACIRFDGYC
ncbi:hypothetical protein Tco_0817925 [Tanacetum coccineum]